MFRKMLVANRGEIACRVMRTARRLGIHTVAVYSDADRRALHVELADEGYRIGPAPAAESYLRGDAILQAAARAGADAIHPGYGFLAESDAFALACGESECVFIGPPVEAIRAMGSKSAARALMEEAGVPVLPGYHGEDQSERTLQRAAERIGYPVLIKPSAGGGGKGMRTVRSPADFADALGSARREARGAFGDDRVIVERFLTAARHVEIQVFADQHGRVVHLFERDCSIQRRHQKIIEEAPAPGLEGSLREAMGAAAVAAARAIGYVGAGTVEFLLGPDGRFHFMEMNTRLQVEHPVTELVTGLDLVEWQIRIASGEPLPCAQEALAIEGHAIEARLYAEDPAQDFLPATGTLQHLRMPASDAYVRIDTGVREGDAVSIYYDPMIAKLIVWDRDRPGAVRRLQRALTECEIVGVATNAPFLAAVVAHPAFVRAELDTNFVEQHRAELLPRPPVSGDELLAIACLQVLADRAQEARQRTHGSRDRWSPWHTTRGWRLNDEGHDVLTFIDRGEQRRVSVHYRDDGYLLDLPGGSIKAYADIDRDGALRAGLAGKRINATVVRQGSELTLLVGGTAHPLTLDDPDARVASHDAAAGRLTAPMPGRVLAVLVEAGQTVARGQKLMVLEAMKMEHTITAPEPGTVEAVGFREGDLVQEGVELLSIKANDAA
ncbi:MAG: acetyl-CoA carboxylase biotin carboxylase subunit [Gammaproteobacteria bacterium]|nr:acetyl-CoA carboxylase biotin carboxylase subunit [Gammaproteobacteria bacterium]